MRPMGDDFTCRRCGRPVERFRDDFETFESMHWTCFHYEFEHDPVEPDEACRDPSCPSRQLSGNIPVVVKEPRLARTVAALVHDLDERFLVLDTAPADLCAINLASLDDPRRSVYVSTFEGESLFSYELEDPSDDPDLPYARSGWVEGVTYEELRIAVVRHLRL